MGEDERGRRRNRREEDALEAPFWQRTLARRTPIPSRPRRLVTAASGM